MKTVDGRNWLAQAAAGGLPEPTQRRWQPLRVGILNLWEYDAAEFWFADGRLVLRGGNGAGKTKVLELTTLMLLRGEVAPSVLDPFGSQHRTMKYNLLPTGEADDPRPPVDAGLGYAWLEFGRRDSSGAARFYVCGLGASARRGTGTGGVSTWQFVTELRPGKDLLLSRAGRPVESKELKKIEGVELPESATRYRARLAAELFGLDSVSYDNLTELLKQLRKPKLGERLNPATLAETLRDALPPLATNEVEQLADGWDRLERLRLVVEATKQAAKHVAGFARTAWLPWARTVVRQRADTFASARTRLDDTTKEKNTAAEQLAAAETDVSRLNDELSTASSARDDADTELRELLESQAYQDAVTSAHRVQTLQDELTSLRERRSGAEIVAAGHREKLGNREVAATEAAAKSADAAVAVGRRSAELSATAEPAGLATSVDWYLPEQDVAGLRADLQRRAERFARLRALHGSYETTRRAAELSAQTLREREKDDARAGRDEQAAHAAVENAVDVLRQQIREWAVAATETQPPEDLVEQWCDLAAELTTGEDSPAAAIRAHTEDSRERLRRRREAVLRERDPYETELDEAKAKLAEVTARKDLPPPAPTLWQRAARPDDDVGSGAPLWRCVQPDAGVSAEQLDRIEAALAASGLLDAWLSPDGMLRTEDGVVVADAAALAGSPVGGDSLVSVLAPTPVGGVSAEIINAVLHGIGWYDVPLDAGGFWLAADGSWRAGMLAGRAEPSRPASFLGATARAEARRREIDGLTARLATLTGRIEELTSAIATLDSRLSTVDGELARIPSEKLVTSAVARWEERRGQREQAGQRLAAARSEHDDEQARQDTAWAEFSTFAGQHRFPLRDLDDVTTVLDAYGAALGRLELALAEAMHLMEAAARAEEARTYQAGLVAAADDTVASLTAQVRTAEIRLRTARHALREDHAEHLARKDRLDTKTRRLAAEIERLGRQLSDGREAVGKAKGTLDAHEGRRAQAERERDGALGAWWEVYDAGLAAAVGLAEPDRRVVEAGRMAVADARRDLADVADEHAEQRTLRRCTQQLHELRQQLLPNRDVRITDDADSGAIPRFLVLAESDTGWQLPDAAANALAAEVRAQEERFDAEQQEVLATLLGSAFIEHLKDRLDYTERTFAGINTRLAAHATRHGHAVRLTHEPDPADLDAGAVVTALNQGYAQLGSARQDMVRSFLARKIDDARAEATADQVADWKEQLSAALDYRRWLRISLEYRPGAQAKWRPFDRAQHGAKSGGEKVVLLSQPLFAAAVVAFDAAGEHAPRWVWLDEAMTGVDAQYKASFMGLTVGFDLDVMLTAHDEWCTYPTVPAVAVYDLARQPHLPGVDAQPHLWFGGELTEVVLAAPAPSADLDIDGSLFTDPEPS